ncbi:MAG: AsmA-like C-terminal region-containing protein [Planctomycetota bacterium]
MKIIGWLLGIVLLLAAVVGGGFFLLTTNTAIGTDLRAVVSNQILGAVNSRTVPQLDWGSSEYERPYTLRLKDLSLTAPDGTKIVEVATAEIVLAETPNTNEPIAIERVTLVDGQVQLIADEAGGFVGLTPFVKDTGAPKSPKPDDGKTTSITEILDLRRIEIKDIDLVYNDGHAEKPMLVPGFGLTLDVKPVDDAASAVAQAQQPDGQASGSMTTAPAGPGWYEMAFDAGREPGLELAVNGRFNINTYDAWLDETTADITVNDETLSSLPGRVRNLLEQYGIRGEIEAVAFGTIKPLDFAASNAQLSIDASGVSAAIGEYKFPLDHLTTSMELAGGSAHLRSFILEAVGGTLTANAEYPLGGSGEGRAEWKADKFDLQRFLASNDTTAPPKIAGLFTMDGNATIDAANPGGSLAGGGTFHLEKGRLMALPIVSQLANTLAVFDVLSNATTLNHRADGTFTLHPTNAELSDTSIVTTAFAAKVQGPIGFDQSLNLKVNAGPFRRAQKLFGDTLGNIFEALTPELVTYRVRGTLAEPSVSVVPLGGGRSSP